MWRVHEYRLAVRAGAHTRAGCLLLQYTISYKYHEQRLGPMVILVHVSRYDSQFHRVPQSLIAQGHAISQ
jgi:hypothetical protein